MTHAHQRFLIDKVLPAEEVHIIGGPSGSGKTRFAFRLIQSWAKGEQFHGHVCHPVPFAYVSCDRSLDSVKRTLDDLAIPHTAFPIYSDVDDNLNNIESVIVKIRAAHPKVEVLFIDGFLSLLPGGKINEYGTVSSWLKSLNRTCKKLHITLVGIVHTSKVKEGEAYLNPREQLMGSAAFAGFADTIIVLKPMDVEEITTQRRRLWLLPRGSAAELYEYEFNGKGELLPVAPLPPSDPSARIRGFLREMKRGETFTFDEVFGLCKISRSQVHRILGTLSRAGLIERLKKGEYVILKDSETANIFPASAPPERES